MTIDKIQVYGERCTGTNYLQTLLTKNLQVQLTWEYGWKHWFPMSPQDHHYKDQEDEIPDNVLVIFIFRNVYDWLRSFHHTPWHCHASLYHVPFSSFIRTQWQCVWPNNTEMMMERNPKTGERFANVLKLRSAKIEHALNFCNPSGVDFEQGSKSRGAKNVYFVKYEDLCKQYPKIIREISGRWNIPMKHLTIQNELKYKGYSSRPFKQKRYPKISEQDLQFINDNLDWDLERQIGYTPE